LFALRGRALALLGHYDEGVGLLRKAAETASEEYGPHRLDTARFLLQLAQIEFRQEKPVAMQTAKRALEAFSKTDCLEAERTAAVDELQSILERSV
jgi:Tetratricopeptide repeat